MGRTVAYYNIVGTSKAKTDKAILVVKDGLESWMPLSVAQVKFIGKDYQVKVTVPDWFFRKISWKPLSEFKPKAKPTPKSGLWNRSMCSSWAVPLCIRAKSLK